MVLPKTVCRVSDRHRGIKSSKGEIVLNTVIAKFGCAVLAAWLYGWGTSALAASLLVNGSFETPTVPAGGFTTFAVGSSAITGWTVVGPAGTNVAPVSTT